MNSVHLFQNDQNRAVCWRGDAMDGVFDFFRERKSTFSLGFRPIGPSVLVGKGLRVRSKVALRGECYVWAPIW